MPRRATSTLVPYSASEMFELVADVERYPEFLPWCRALRVVDRREGEHGEVLIADLMVGYRMFRETFRSRVTLDRERFRIDTRYVRGPMRDMSNLWRFEPHPWEREDIGAAGPLSTLEGCIVQFAVAFSLINPMMERAAKLVFEDAFSLMSEAFIDRAAAVYGERTGESVLRSR